MKTRLARCLCILTTVFCMSLVLAEEPQRSAPEVQLIFEEKTAMPSPEAVGPVYAEFFQSPKLTALLRDEFRRRGYQVTDDREQATVRVEVAAMYALHKSLERPVHVDFGQVFEGAAAEKSITDLANTGELSRMNAGETALVSGINAGLFAGGLIDTIGLGTGIVQAISNAAGIKSAFNRLVVGDSRGLCLFNCKNWNKYKQALIFSANAPT